MRAPPERTMDGIVPSFFHTSFVVYSIRETVQGFFFFAILKKKEKHCDTVYIRE